jgi:hypothetical protein
MQNTLTNKDHLVHKVTIHHGLGRSVTPDHPNESPNWAIIEEHLNAPARHGLTIVLDYWQDDAKREHPPVPAQLITAFSLDSHSGDRLHSITVRPIPGTVRFDSYSHPQTVSLASSDCELYLVNHGQNRRLSIAGEFKINLHTGRIVIT